MGQRTRQLRILVTGGQGFLGQSLVKALLELGFENVAATVRREAPEFEDSGVEVVRVDLTKKKATLAATVNRDVIFHTAAKAGVWGDESLYRAVNVDATEFLLEGARKNGVSYFIHTSSPSVTFQGRPSLDENENAPYGFSPFNAYCATKIESEKAVLAGHGRLKCLALRPHLIYGPGDPHLLPRVFEAARSGRLVRIGNGLNQVDITHVDDAVAAHLCALFQRELSDIWGRAYFITSGVPVRLWSWLSHVLSWKKLPRVKRSLSLRRALVIGRWLEKGFRVLGKSSEPPLTEFSALQLGCDHTYSIESARRLLGYRPTTNPYQDFDTQLGPRLREWSQFTQLY